MTHQEQRDAQSDDAGNDVVIKWVFFVSENFPHHHDREDLEALRQHLRKTRTNNKNEQKQEIINQLIHEKPS